jgi:hypothetical protein
LFVADCGSAPTVYDKSVSMEQSCKLRIADTRVTSFDGQKGLGGKVPLLNFSCAVLMIYTAKKTALRSFKECVYLASFALFV